MKVIVIGAGPAGLSCAYQLSKEPNVSVEVYEASPYIGGMSRSFDLWGQRVDLGPHRFFSKQKEINDFFMEMVDEEYVLVNRQTRIYYRNSFFDYPLKLFNVLRNLSLVTIIQILFTFFWQKLFPINNPKNFEEWVKDRFGSKLFQIFFKSYTEKLWGIKCTRIDADWAAQRIKTLTLFEAVKSAVIGNRGNKHKTLVDVFAYPNNGTGAIYENATKKIIQNGGKVHLESPVKKVMQQNGKVSGIELTDGSVVTADYVVSTMPLTLLLKGLEEVPKPVLKAADKLYFRNTILVYLEVDNDKLFTDNWLYIHSPDVTHGRITNFRNWAPTLTKDKNTSILCLEFWCFENDKIWNFEDQILAGIAKNEIFKINLIPEDAKILNTHVIRIPRCYPVYEIGYREHINVLIDYLNNFKNLVPIGRYGAFKYNNQDHSILMGILAAQKIAEGKEIDLWKINTDSEYQEDSEIKDVLVQ